MECGFNSQFSSNLPGQACVNMRHDYSISQSENHTITDATPALPSLFSSTTDTTSAIARLYLLGQKAFEKFKEALMHSKLFSDDDGT